MLLFFYLLYLLCVENIFREGSPLNQTLLCLQCFNCSCQSTLTTEWTLAFEIATFSHLASNIRNSLMLFCLFKIIYIIDLFLCFDILFLICFQAGSTSGAPVLPAPIPRPSELFYNKLNPLLRDKVCSNSWIKVLWFICNYWIKILNLQIQDMSDRMW